MGWNYLSIPNFSRCTVEVWQVWQPTLYLVCNNLSMLGFKLIHVSKWGPWSLSSCGVCVSASHAHWCENTLLPTTGILDAFLCIIIIQMQFIIFITTSYLIFGKQRGTNGYGFNWQTSTPNQWCCVFGDNCVTTHLWYYTRNYVSNINQETISKVSNVNVDN